MLGEKDTIRPEDSASNVQVNKPEDEVDWNEEETDIDVKKREYLESVKPKTRPPNRSTTGSAHGETKSSGARGSGQAAPASEHTEVKSSGARGVGHSFTSAAEVTQKETEQAHVPVGQKYKRTLLAKAEEPVEELRNIVNDYLDRREQCVMTHVGGFRYINRANIPEEHCPPAICHSYMAGVQYALPMRSQIVQAVERQDW